jgi:Flp pilus assembly protein TadD
VNGDFAAAVQFMTAGRDDLAERHLRLALSSEPEDPLVHALLAECLAGRQEVVEAAAEAQESIRLAPDRPEGYAALASAQAAARRWRDAERSIKEALRFDSSVPSYWSRLAHILVGQGRTGRAIEAASQGLKLRPTDIGCLNGRALALLDDGRVREARETIRSALVSAPVSAELHSNLAYVLIAHGELPAAHDEALEALRLDPSLRTAQQMLRASEGRNSWSRRIELRALAWWQHRPVWERNVFVVGLAAAGVVSPVTWILALMIALMWAVLSIAQFVFRRTARLDRAPRGLLSPLIGFATLLLGAQMAGGSVARSVGRRSISRNDLASAAACLPVAALILVAFLVGARPVIGYRLPALAAIVSFAILGLSAASARPTRQLLFLLALVVIAAGTWDAVFVGPSPDPTPGNVPASESQPAV